MLPVILAVVLTAGGTGSMAAPPVSIDMVTANYSDSISSPNHLGHWPAPTAGSPTFLTINATAAGVGEGTVTFGVLIEGSGTVCTLTAPCTHAPGDTPAHVQCPTAVAEAGAFVHLTWSHTCVVAPAGTLVAGFEWTQ